MPASERRDTPRIPLRLLVQYRVETVDEFDQTYATNLSVGGMFIEGEERYQQGEMLYFQFRLTDGTPLIEGMGRVAHVNPPGSAGAGCGIEFVNVDTPSLQFIDAAIERRNAAPA
ncbi:MAG: PilZ domain-containing protein [Myxococcota bacterium]